MRRDIAISLFIGLCVSACGSAHVPAAVARPERAPAVKLAAVRFPTAGDRVQGRDRAILADHARWMRENAQAVVVLEGHCDERGSPGRNLALGDRRARSVAADLAQGGVDAGRLVIVSRGEADPLDARHLPAAWARNRRVEFRIR